MIYAGEDPRFILRRLIVLAGEDIGLADPMGIVVANAAAHAFDYIGLPEGVYPLVEATLYLSTAPKSNSAGGYFKAMHKLEEEGQVSVPRHLMDSNRDGDAMGHGKDYVYPMRPMGTSLRSSTCRDGCSALTSTDRPGRATRPRCRQDCRCGARRSEKRSGSSRP